MKFSTMNTISCNSVNSSPIEYNFNDINNLVWAALDDLNFDKYGPYMLINLRQLNPHVVAKAIVKSTFFAKGFVRHLISDNNIELYHNICKEYHGITSELFEKSDDDTKKHLANYLFQHLEQIKDIPFALQNSIDCSNDFCDMMANKIMSGDLINIHWLNDKLDSNNFKIMLKRLSPDVGKKFFSFLLNKESRIKHKILIDASEVDCKLESTTYNEALSKHIIDKKDWELVKKICDWNALLNSNKLKEEWEKFILNNIYAVHTANPHAFEYILTVRPRKFKHDFIEKMIEKDFVLVNFPLGCYVLKLLFEGSSNHYKQKLQKHYVNHAQKLNRTDAYVIATSWDKIFVNELEKKLYWLKRDGLKSKAIHGIYEHKYRKN